MTVSFRWMTDQEKLKWFLMWMSIIELTFRTLKENKCQTVIFTSQDLTRFPRKNNLENHMANAQTWAAVAHLAGREFVDHPEIMNLLTSQHHLMKNDLSSPRHWSPVNLKRNLRLNQRQLTAVREFSAAVPPPPKRSNLKDNQKSLLNHHQKRELQASHQGARKSPKIGIWSSRPQMTRHAFLDALASDLERLMTKTIRMKNTNAPI